MQISSAVYATWSTNILIPMPKDLTSTSEYSDKVAAVVCPKWALINDNHSSFVNTMWVLWIWIWSNSRIFEFNYLLFCYFIYTSVITISKNDCKRASRRITLLSSPLFFILTTRLVLHLRVASATTIYRLMWVSANRAVSLIHTTYIYLDHMNRLGYTMHTVNNICVSV